MLVSASRETNDPSVFSFEDVTFSSISGQSKLFLDYLADPRKLTEFYPSAVPTINELSTQVPDVLAGYTVDRGAVCSMLERQNIACESGSATFENIEELRSANCVAVLTGQQAGIFSGPLYTIYKALSAIKASATLSQIGTPAVPVFWIASEDHDLDEVSKNFAVAKNGDLVESIYTSPKTVIGKPVGDVTFDDSIKEIIERLFAELPQTEFTPKIRDLLNQTYCVGESFASAFAKVLARLFSDHGLIIFDPQDAEARRLVSPILRSSIERSSSIVDAVIDRSSQLESEGYRSQVLVEENYFPLFWFDESGVRRSLKRSANGTFKATETKHDFTIDDLLSIAKERPELLSPGVMLRPVVQDFLFPTICYFGGGAEISYFAQNSEVYRILERRPSAIFHRNSFTIVDPRHSRSMTRYGLRFLDLFTGKDELLARIVDEMIDTATSVTFVDVEERINTELNRLDETLSQIDPTLAEGLAKRRRKIIYHIGVLRNKTRRASLERDETVHRRISSLFNSVLPKNGLQERTLGIPSFLNSYGPELIRWVYESVDLDNKDHRVLYL